jgi:hypothetical protein
MAIQEPKEFYAIGKPSIPIVRYCMRASSIAILLSSRKSLAAHRPALNLRSNSLLTVE